MGEIKKGGQEKMIRCPYCLKKVKPRKRIVEFTSALTYTCGNNECAAQLPRDFVENKQAPKTNVGLVGFTGHGKTVYLTSLFYLLKFLPNVWEGFTWRCLDEQTLSTIYEHVSSFEETSQLPPGTSENFPKPSLIQFTNISSFKNYFISFYDTAGAVYEDVERITDKGRFVAFSEVVLFIISMINCNQEGELPNKMAELLNIYIRAVYDSLGVNLKKNQHLIVVLTKGDEIIESLPNDLKNFLLGGTYEWYGNNNLNTKVLKELKEKSNAIRLWLNREKQCSNFTNLAQENFKTVEYTLISSLGAAPVGNQLAAQLNPVDPKRVLDPFLWVLEKTRPKKIWELFTR